MKIMKKKNTTHREPDSEFLTGFEHEIILFNAFRPGEFSFSFGGNRLINLRLVIHIMRFLFEWQTS
jgi:hypothetical protein